eukprot:scaffold1655_cov247-Pinguiococcus_pyrenoidosus.AAC.17
MAFFPAAIGGFEIRQGPDDLIEQLQQQLQARPGLNVVRSVQKGQDVRKEGRLLRSTCVGRLKHLEQHAAVVLHQMREEIKHATRHHAGHSAVEMTMLSVDREKPRRHWHPVLVLVGRQADHLLRWEALLSRLVLVQGG